MSRPDDYLLERMARRVRRSDRPDFDVKIVFGLIKHGDKTWDAAYEWLDSCAIEYFTYSPFSDDWRRYFGFKSKADAALFKLKFAP